MHTAESFFPKLCQRTWQSEVPQAELSLSKTGQERCRDDLSFSDEVCHIHWLHKKRETLYLSQLTLQESHSVKKKPCGGT